MWDAVNPHTGKRRVDEAFPPELFPVRRDQEMMVRARNGSTWQLVGSDNFNSLMGSPPVGLVYSEYAVANPAAWGYMRPILLENGGWAIFISTPRGKNHFYDLLRSAGREPGWFSQTLTNDDTRVFTKAEMDAELRQMQAAHGEDYGRSLWMQEYFSSFDAAIPGSIWGDMIDRLMRAGRIGRFGFDPALSVHTGWDLGRTDDTVIWFYQVLWGEVRVIDYHESNMKDAPYYGRLLRGEREASSDPDSPDERLKARTRHYRYGTHWLPHDARPRTLAGGGRSILQQLNAENVGRCAIAPRLDVQEGIQAGRATLARAWFNLAACEAGIERLRAYHRVWDAELKRFSDHPEHDASSHAADAWRTLAVAWREVKPPAEKKPAPVVRGPATIGEYIRLAERERAPWRI